MQARHTSALTRAGYDSKLLDKAVAEGRVRFVVGDLSQTDFGLPEDTELVGELRREVTAIVHCAWTVDFKRALPSFIGDIKGVRNLVDFTFSCARSTDRKKASVLKTRIPKIVFVSSISVAHASTALIPEGALPSVRGALGSGYAESKWAAETILQRAAAASLSESLTSNSSSSSNSESALGSSVEVVRLGQLAGARMSGAWKATEWVPSLIMGSTNASAGVGCLPDVPGSVGWVDVESAASAILDVNALSPSPAPSPNDDTGRARFFHVAHPNPVPWSTLMQAFSKRLGGVPIVPYAEWLAKLEEAQEALTQAGEEEMKETLENNPALRLVDFFRERGRVHFSSSSSAVKFGEKNDLEPIGMPHLELSCSVATLSSLRTLKESSVRLGEEDVARWIGWWKQSGALKS